MENQNSVFYWQNIMYEKNIPTLELKNYINLLIKNKQKNNKIPKQLDK